MIAKRLKPIATKILDIAAAIHARTLRPLLPTTETVSLAGISTGYEYKVGDRLFRDRFRMHRTIEVYEPALIQGLTDYIETGDTVIVVGGGWAITSIVAARQTGPTGKVITFEGSPTQYEYGKLSIATNGITNIDLRNQIVGDNVRVYHLEGVPDHIMPGDQLPACDVLEMDCEGAEITILKSLAQRPRVILVETHGFLGAPTTEVRACLEEMGYEVRDLGIAETMPGSKCEERDVRVLAARYQG